MKNTITLVIVFFSLFNCSAQSIAPSVINAGVDLFNPDYYQFEWSIGELALVGEMNSSNNSLVIQMVLFNPSFNTLQLITRTIFLVMMRSKFFQTRLQAMLK
jgi:hypothetical protein